MADITNQDILNAIRGLYQSPNKVADAAVLTKLGQLQTEIEAVKAENIAIKTKLNGTLDTKLTGSNVRGYYVGDGVSNPLSVESIIPRNIYNSGFDSPVITVPYGVRGLSIIVRFFALTGAFVSGEGVRLGVDLLSNNHFGSTTVLVESLYTDFTANPNGSIKLTIGDFDDLPNELYSTRVRSKKYVKSGVFFPFFRIKININGNIGSGEGADISANLIWHY